MGRIYEDVAWYVEEQSQGKCKVLSAKPEHSFDDLGIKVPMNLYSQGAHYFSADEVYSFHMGIMERMLAKSEEYQPEGFVKAITLDTEMAPTLF